VKVAVDNAKCVGHARCHFAAPEAFDLDDNLPAARRPETEMDATAQLRLGADRQAPDGDQMFRNEGLGRCYELLLLVRDAYAGARVHAATPRSPTSHSFAPAID